LRPVPVPHPSAVLNLRSQLRGHGPESMSYADYVDLPRQSARLFRADGFPAGTFGFAADRQALPEMKGRVAGERQLLSTCSKSFRNSAAHSRREEDAVPGRDAVTVISHDLWQRDFGSAPDIVGQKDFGGWHEFAIIGVARKASPAPTSIVRPAFYIPLMMAPRLSNHDQNLLVNRADRELQVKARLAPGATAEQAAAEARVIAKPASRRPTRPPTVSGPPPCAPSSRRAWINRSRRDAGEDAADTRRRGAGDRLRQCGQPDPEPRAWPAPAKLPCAWPSEPALAVGAATAGGERSDRPGRRRRRRASR